MSQELVNLLKRTLRMPWEVKANPQKWDV